MRLDVFFISIVLATIFITGGLVYIDDAMDSYNITTENQYFKNIEKDTELIYNVSSEMKDDTQTQSVSADTAENNIFISGYKTMKKTWTMFTVGPKLVGDIGLALGVPSALFNGFIVIMTLTVLFSIVYTIWRFMPR